MAVVPPEIPEPISAYEREVLEAMHNLWTSGRRRQKLAWARVHRRTMHLLFQHPLITAEIEDVLRQYL